MSVVIRAKALSSSRIIFTQHDAMIFFSLPRRECHVQNSRRFGIRASPNVSDDDDDDVLKLRSRRVIEATPNNNTTRKSADPDY